MRLLTLWLSLLLLPSLALGWGYDGHRRLAARMGDPLPPRSCLRQFIAAQQSAAFQDRACDPDRWKGEGGDPGEWSRHYLNPEWATPMASYPREWAQAQAQFGRYAEKNGQVPWRVEEYVEKLTVAFRGGDVAEILPVMAHLSHYVTDAFSVLHDTRNYDPDGLHGRWESQLLDARGRIDGITALSGEYLGTIGRGDPSEMIFDVVLVGNALVEELIRADRASARGDGGYDLARLYEGAKELTARRWGDALTLQASLVAQAWVDAGKPRLPGMAEGCEGELPQGQVVLRGYPVAWTGADAGSWIEPEPDEPEPPSPPVDPAPRSGCGGGVLAMLGLAAAVATRMR
jgi:hypothetical protein